MGRRRWHRCWHFYYLRLGWGKRLGINDFGRRLRQGHINYLFFRLNENELFLVFNVTPLKVVLIDKCDDGLVSLTREHFDI